MTKLGTPPADTGTKLAVDRTRLAYERTMMAWVRTSMSLISFGFTIHKFFQYRVEQGAISPTRVLGPTEFGAIMVATGLGALVLASYDHRRSLMSLRESYGPMPHSVAATIGFVMATLGLLVLAAMMFGL